MIDLAPFTSPEEHIAYCMAAEVPFEEGSIGFKIFADDDKMGMIQLKLVGDAAYVLAVTAIDHKISTQLLANIFLSVVQFMEHLGVSSIVYPIQSDSDTTIAEAVGLDRVSETLYVYDFVNEEEEEEGDHHCGGCGEDHCCDEEEQIYGSEDCFEDHCSHNHSHE